MSEKFKFNAHVLIMQYNQLPKLHFRFKKIYALNLLNETQSIINEKLINFNAIIPEKISKQVLRIQRSQNKENASDISLRDGSTLKMANLFKNNNNLNAEKYSDIDFKVKSTHNHNLRKRRIESNIHSELINFFASGLVPTLLRSDYALWSIVRVKTF